MKARPAPNGWPTQRPCASIIMRVPGQVQLSDAEIDAALSDRWPSTTPEPLRIQLLELGRELYADEGLSPDIPPPPTLCNTVEGGRYRDLLAKQGQARNDRTMLVSALAVISEALAPIARAAPPMQGDVLVVGPAVRDTAWASDQIR